MSRLSERQPRGTDWQPVPLDGPLAHEPSGAILARSRWASGPILVVSTLNMAELPDRSGVGPQWNISISRMGKRPKPHHVRRALRAFNMVDAEEDNHLPGNARHFWMPVDAAHRVDCECKEEEAVITDKDGYQWTNPHDAAECRGCENAPLTGRPCPLHSGAAEARR